jgi:hypothetical protein
MNPAALLARLTARGYTPASHARHPETWLNLEGPAGSIRVVIDPGGDCTQICGLGPRPGGPAIFDIWLSAGAPEAVTAGTLNAAESWLAGPAAAPLTSPQPGTRSRLPRQGQKS